MSSGDNIKLQSQTGTAKTAEHQSDTAKKSFWLLLARMNYGHTPCSAILVTFTRSELSLNSIQEFYNVFRFVRFNVRTRRRFLVNNNYQFDCDLLPKPQRITKKYVFLSHNLSFIRDGKHNVEQHVALHCKNHKSSYYLLQCLIKGRPTNCIRIIYYVHTSR